MMSLDDDTYSLFINEISKLEYLSELSCLTAAGDQQYSTGVQEILKKMKYLIKFNNRLIN